MRGRDYIAVRPMVLRTASGPIQLAAGARCDAVAESSLPWLLEDGHVTLAPVEPAPEAAQGETDIEEAE